MVRAAAKNHAQRRDRHVAGPLRRRPRRDRGRRGACRPAYASALAVEAFRHTAAYDARIADELPARMAEAGVELPDEPGLPGAGDPYPPTLTIGLEKVETLRYGENPHQPAARYRRPGRHASTGRSPRARRRSRASRCRTTTSSTRPPPPPSPAPCDGPGCVIVKHTNPCGAAERPTLAGGLAGGPRRRPGVGVRRRCRDQPRDRPGDGARRWPGSSSSSSLRRRSTPAALEVLAAKPNLRLVVDPGLGGATDAGPAASRAGSARLGPDGRRRRPRHLAGPRLGRPLDLAGRHDPPPDRRGVARPHLAWRLVRGVTSNAIVLVRDGRSSASARARRAASTPRARRSRRLARSAARLRCGARPAARMRSTRSPTASRSAWAPGVTAFAQPGGSMRDADVIAAAEDAGATMLLTGIRHFRH